MTTTRAIVSRDLLANGGWKLEDIKVRPPGEGELLVEMVASGICHTDLVVGGLPTGAVPFAFYPRVLGHEGSGYVRAVGPGVTVAAVGDPVLCSYNYCDTCAICHDGHPYHCDKFQERNLVGLSPDAFTSSTATASSSPEVAGLFFGQSSFSHFSLVHSTSVVNVAPFNPTKHDLQLFAPLGCGIQTGAGTVLHAARASPSDSIAVLGLGGVGLSAIMAAKLAGCRIIIGIDRIASRLTLARELGCTHVIDTSPFGDIAADPSKLIAQVREIADGVGTTVTVDTTGFPPLMEAGVEFLRNCGKYIQVGGPPFDYVMKSTNAFQFMLSGKQFIGAAMGHARPTDFLPKMVQWYREGKFPVDKLIKLTPAEDFETATKQMHSGETIKPVLTWS